MRFAGSGVSFEAPTLASAGGSTGAAAAAGAVDIGNAFATARMKAPKYDELSSMAMQTNSAEKQVGMNAAAQVTGAGIQSFGQTQGMAMHAKASIEAAEKEAEATKSAGMMSALGSVASAGLGLIKLSDETTKFDVKRIDTALETLRNLKPVTFYYKEEFSSSPERMHHGFIAQEFQKVLPDATYFDESIGKMCIDTGDVIGLLVRANQELEARIGMLEAKQALATV
jgi:hypothetical protein